MKRVSLFIDSLGPGGAQRQIVGLAILLKKKGFDVKLATYFDFLLTSIKSFVYFILLCLRVY